MACGLCECHALIDNVIASVNNDDGQKKNIISGFTPVFYSGAGLTYRIVMCAKYILLYDVFCCSL